MLKISKISDYAVVVLVDIALQGEQCVSASAISKSTRLPEPTVSKVLKLLAKSGIVLSTRGIHGGYSLARAPEDISVEKIITAIDGPVSIIACSDGAVPDCGVSNVCSVRGRWDGVNSAIRDTLIAVTLADMIDKEEYKKYGGH